MSDPTVDGPTDDAPAEPSAPDSPTDVSESGTDVPSADPGVPADDGLDGSEEQDDEAGDPVLDVMAVLEAERDGYLLDLQRMTAEFANYRKQADRRTAEVGGRARGDLAEKLLVVFDGDHDVRHRSQPLDGPACRSRLRPRSMRFVPGVTSAKHATC